MELSIVSPVYHGEKMLNELVQRIHAAIKELTDDYEIILVNDCSPDLSWQKITEICRNKKKVQPEPQLWTALCDNGGSELRRRGICGGD